MTTTEATYTFATVGRMISAPTPEEIQLFKVTATPAELVAMGARIGTVKVITDGVRWMGQAAHFLNTATPQQRRLLGVSNAQVRVAFHELKELDRRQRARSGETEATGDTRAVDRADAASTEQEGRAEREVLNGMLENAALDDPKALAAVAAAYGTAPDAAGVAASLRQLAGVGKRWLDEGGAPGQRLALLEVTRDSLGAAEVLAQRVETTAAKATGAGVEGAVSQSQLDAQDGVVLFHMERLLNSFKKARKLDGTVPVLVPITTRSVFAKPKGTAKAADGGTPVGG